MIRLIKLSFLLLLAIFLACSGKPIASNLEKIEIKKVDFELTSIISVNCSEFENYFQEEVSASLVESESELALFAGYLNEMTQDEEGYEPDVRAKILIYRNNGNIDTLCMSELGMVFNGKPMLIHSKLLEFVASH